MKVLMRGFLFLFLMVLILPRNTFGQVTATDANAIKVTEYDTTHFIYIYNQHPAVKQGNFAATSPWGGNATFIWSQYDTTSKTFSAPFKAETGTDTSFWKTSVGGGYRVIVDSGTIKKDTFIFWFYPHKLTISVLKNAENKIPYYKYSCSYVNLDATATTDTFKYFNPFKNKRYVLKNDIVYTWTCEPAGGGTFWPKASFRIPDPPTKTTEYTCTITDSFKYTPISDKVTFDAVRVKAFYTKIEEEEFNNKHSAPYTVRFFNESENGLKFTWYIDDTDTLFDKPDSISYTFKKSGFHAVKLFAERKDCNHFYTDSIFVDLAEIKGEPEKQTLYPNYFIPDGEKKFLPKNVSVDVFSFTIFSRWGKLVYEEKNAPDKHMEDMVGWNGMIGNSLATEGVYFYVLVAKPFDKPKPESQTEKPFQETYKGFFYLFHQK